MNIFPVHISFLISHVATATLLLRKKICPRKSYSNLKQLILFRLLKNRCYNRIHVCPAKVSVDTDESHQNHKSGYCRKIIKFDTT